MVAEQTVRRLAASDLDAIMRIEKRCYPMPWSEGHFRQEFNNAVASILGCYDDGTLAGYLCFWFIVDEMQVLNVAVDPAYRRRGIAAALLRRAIAECRVRGMVSAWLEVRAGNKAAIALYGDLGFVVEGTRRRYYRDGEDALLMVRTFAPSRPSENT